MREGKLYICALRSARAQDVANVAQLVEQLIRNEQVSGSSPLIGSLKTTFVDALRADMKVVFVLWFLLAIRRARYTQEKVRRL